MNATVRLDAHRHAGDIDPRIFSGFIEHLGRAIYGGIFDPGNPRSDERGFRTDVIDALKRLRMPLMRYPGGNFVSAYDWRDGVGPAAARPARPDYAWRTIEPNTFGTDEFMAWCAAAGVAPMMAVNLGTLGAAEAAALVEYCNLPQGTRWADQRARNGHPQPYGAAVWCLGNEMDGPWQAGHVPAGEYAMRAQQAGKLMKGLDPRIQLAACGSSHSGMPTYLRWDREVLEYCWDDIDFISAHRYTSNHRGDTPWFLAEGVEVDRIIEDYAALLGYVRAVKRGKHRVHLSFDEWNVWDWDDFPGPGPNAPWRRAPALLEQVYTLEDALVDAQFLMSFIRHADVVKIACIAQAVNVIAPMLVRPDGLLIQSIFHPFEMLAGRATGRSLTPAVDAPTYDARDRGEVMVIDAAASFDPAQNRLGVFVVNRSTAEDAVVRIELAGTDLRRVLEAQVLTTDETTGIPKTANTWEQPGRVVPRALRAEFADGAITLVAPRLSFVALTAQA